MVFKINATIVQSNVAVAIAIRIVSYVKQVIFHTLNWTGTGVVIQFVLRVNF